MAVAKAREIESRFWRALMARAAQSGGIRSIHFDDGSLIAYEPALLDGAIRDSDAAFPELPASADLQETKPEASVNYPQPTTVFAAGVPLNHFRTVARATPLPPYELPDETP